MLRLKSGFYAGSGSATQRGSSYSFPSKNLHNITGIGGLALQWFVKQCVHCCPRQIGVAGFFAAAGFIRRAVATGGGGATDCHE
ncbi:hypothetical protein MTE2_4839 [Klebsiella pneumoniae VA360]|nr:hypothetical protein MTE2_4839 [Klebsiella pneumoniae VA360]